MIKNAENKFRLGEVATEIKAGFSCGKFELDKGDIPHLRPMNIDNDCNLTWEGTKYISLDFFKDKVDYSLKKGDILFNNTNSTEWVGKSCYISNDYECGFSNHMTRIRVNEKIADSYYLSQLLFGMWKNRVLESYCHKWVNQSGINTEILSNIPILLPSLDEQARLVELFQSIEQSIVRAQAQEGNLKALRKKLSNGLASQKPAFGNLLSSKNCQPRKFANLADCIEQHDKTPLENGIARFVGLENIQAESFQIQGWGNIAEGTTFTKRFAKGDVLFGKRRAYLKKIAVADFDGICSSDILVLRAKTETILPELLPYYASSDAFINHAISTSAGSLSPRTKWRDLAELALSVPEMQAQKKIVGVFQQIETTLAQLRAQTHTLKTLKQKLLNEILGG
ncbi:MAG: restriction endonuclease subunit S [Chloroflexi bacterium]|nr:restriction endonuclease subunit S [Chloroflexota bacterium]